MLLHKGVLYLVCEWNFIINFYFTKDILYLVSGLNFAIIFYYIEGVPLFSLKEKFCHKFILDRRCSLSSLWVKFCHKFLLNWRCSLFSFWSKFDHKFLLHQRCSLRGGSSRGFCPLSKAYKNLPFVHQQSTNLLSPHVFLFTNSKLLMLNRWRLPCFFFISTCPSKWNLKAIVSGKLERNNISLQVPDLLRSSIVVEKEGIIEVGPCLPLYLHK